MCATCSAVRGKSQSDALGLVADAMQSGGDREHLSKLMDQILDTESESVPEDPALAAEFHRRTKE